MGNVCGNLFCPNRDLDEIIPIQWNGNTFTINGQYLSGGTTYEIKVTGTLSTDGETIESATFYKKETTATGTVDINELEVANVPFFASYPGPLDAHNATYVYQVEGENDIREAVVSLRSQQISSLGKVQRDTSEIVF